MATESGIATSAPHLHASRSKVATGIGAFYDEEVHRYLNLAPDRGQVVYHFAIGYPAPDPHLET